MLVVRSEPSLSARASGFRQPADPERRPAVPAGAGQPSQSDFQDREVVVQQRRTVELSDVGEQRVAHGVAVAEQRIEEIARMLSGAAVTEEARAAARRLLVEAQTPARKLRKRA